MGESGAQSGSPNGHDLSGVRMCCGQGCPRPEANDAAAALAIPGIWPGAVFTLLSRVRRGHARLGTRVRCRLVTTVVTVSPHPALGLGFHGAEPNAWLIAAPGTGATGSGC
jgi:hypothetical protein